MRFFQQRFQSAVQLHTVARDLVFAAHHRPPEALLGVDYKAQGQLLSHGALHQTFGVGKVFLPATTTANIFLCTSIPAIWYGIGTRARQLLLLIRRRWKWLPGFSFADN
jgi:hypothetical protein